MKDLLTLPKIASIASYVCIGAIALSGNFAASIGLLGSLTALLVNQYLQTQTPKETVIVSREEFEEIRSKVNSLSLSVGLSKVDRK